MERDNRDEDMMLKGTKQEMPGFRFRLLRPEKKRELWNPDFELLFLLRGSGRVSYEDGEVHNLPMGSIFAINRFQICDLDLDEDGLALSLCVSAETIDSFHIKLLKCEVKCQSFFYMEDQQEKFDLIRRDMARIFLEMYKNNEEQPIYMKSRVTALLEDLLFYFTSGEKVEQGRGGRERIQRASDYILQHCREEITLEDLADHLYLSRAYISRSFPQYFGVSFREYVTQVRLAHAVQEMHSGATLTEIAYHNGFVNETAMIRAFRKYRGMTPSEYRKQMEYTVKQKIQNIYAALRPSEQKVASFFLAHAGELESLTIGELASAAGVSEPTVIRCVRGLGYRGYRAFEGALRGREAGEESSFDHLGASPSGPGTGWRTCR